MEHNQNTIAAINHQRAIRNKFRNHSWLFHQSAEKIAVFEGLFWQSGPALVAFAVVEGFKHESMYAECPRRDKKVAVVERWPLVEVRLYTLTSLLMNTALRRTTS